MSLSRNSMPGSLNCCSVAIDVMPQGVLTPLARLKRFSKDDHMGTLTLMKGAQIRNTGEGGSDRKKRMIQGSEPGLAKEKKAKSSQESAERLTQIGF